MVPNVSVLTFNSLFNNKKFVLFRPANCSDGCKSGRVVVEVDVGEHEGQAEVGEVVTRVESF